MNKSSLIVLANISLLALSSCGQAEAPVVTPPAADTTTQQTQTESSSNTQNSEQANKETTQTTRSSEQEFTGKIEDIFKKGKTMTCHIVATESGATMEGTVYFDGKNMASRMVGKENSEEMTANSIMKDGYTYMWTNMAKQGTKMKNMADEEGAEMNIPMAGNLNEAQDENVKFSCKEGITDPAAFTVPTDVTFIDMNMNLDMNSINKMYQDTQE